MSDWVALNHLGEGKIFPERDSIGGKKCEKPTVYMGNVAMWLKHKSMKEGSKSLER